LLDQPSTVQFPEKASGTPGKVSQTPGKVSKSHESRLEVLLGATTTLPWVPKTGRGPGDMHTLHPLNPQVQSISRINKLPDDFIPFWLPAMLRKNQENDGQRKKPGE
jgi:hypothetical protein